MHDDGADAYERALKALDVKTRDWWQEMLDEADEEEPELSATAEHLANWIETVVKGYFERQLTALIHRDALREQAFGGAFKPDSLEKLARYETHLDRKLERILTVLVKLQELRRDREKQEQSPGIIDEELTAGTSAP